MDTFYTLSISVDDMEKSTLFPFIKMIGRWNSSNYTTCYCESGYDIIKVLTLTESPSGEVHNGLLRHPSLNDSDYFVIKFIIKNERGDDLHYIIKSFAFDEYGRTFDVKNVVKNNLIGVAKMEVDLGEETQKKVNLYVGISAEKYRNYYDDEIIIVNLEIDRVKETLSIKSVGGKL